jgi:hypothetical protein
MLASEGQAMKSEGPIQILATPGGSFAVLGGWENPNERADMIMHMMLIDDV